MSLKSSRRGAVHAVAAAIVSIGVIVAVAAPARAAVPFSWHQRGYTAMSTWQLADQYNTFVGIYGSARTDQIKDRTDQIQGGKPVPAGSVSISIAQSYCDLANDRWVDRFWDGYADAAVTVARDLSTVSWPSVTVTLSGTQYDYPLIGHSCSEVDWANGTPAADPPPVLMTATAAFTASGSMTITNGVEHVRYDSRFYVTVNLDRARTASAVDARLVTSSPFLTALNSLPAPDLAQIGHTIHTEITVSHGHNPLAAGQRSH